MPLGEPTVVTSMRLSRRLRVKADAVAKMRGVPVAQLLKEAATPSIERWAAELFAGPEQPAG